MKTAKKIPDLKIGDLVIVPVRRGVSELGKVIFIGKQGDDISLEYCTVEVRGREEDFRIGLMEYIGRNVWQAEE